MDRMDVWGQGAIFAFSGLEGKTDYFSQLIGFLSGDRPGIRFIAPTRFEISMDTTGVSVLA